MPICLDLCFHMLVHLDLCSLHALCYLPCACEPHAMFVCLELGYVCHAMCYCSPFVALSFFLVFLVYWFGLDLELIVFVTICTRWPTSKGLDHPYLHVYACLPLCFMLVIAYFVLGFAMLDALSGFGGWLLHPMPMRPCLDVTIWDASPWCWLLYAYPSIFPLRAILCLPCLFMPPIGFLCIFTHLLTCPCISLAGCVVHAST